MEATLTAKQLRDRAGQLRLVLTDVDGVLTDAGVYYSADGEALKRFSLRDGMGMELLREQGVQTAIVTRENSPIVMRRAEKLKLRHVYLGVWDKRAHLAQIVADTALNLDQLAYIGDDVNDYEIMKAIGESGLVGCPADAVRDVQQLAHYRCSAKGGYGAFREFAEWLLALRARATP